MSSNITLPSTGPILQYWEVRLAEYPVGKYPTNEDEASHPEYIKFHGLYVDLAIANEKCRELLQGRRKVMNEYLKDLPESSQFRWSYDSPTGGNSQTCCLLKNVYTEDRADGHQVLLVALMRRKMKKKLDFHIDPEIRHLMIWRELSGVTAASSRNRISTEARKFPVKAWSIKLRLILGNTSGRQDKRCFEECIGTYLGDEDVDRKAIDLFDKYVERGWEADEIHGSKKKYSTRLIWVVNKDSGARRMLGRIEGVMIADAAAMATIKPIKEDEGSAKRFPLTAWRVYLKDDIPQSSVDDTELAQNGIQGTYESQLAAISQALDLRQEHCKLGWAIYDNYEEGMICVKIGDFGPEKLYCKKGGLEKKVFAWIGRDDEGPLVNRASKYCWVQQVIVKDEEDAKGLE